MKIAVLGVGHIGSTVGRLWHAAGHEVTFAARDAAEPRALAEELGGQAHAAATAADAVAAADVVLVSVPGAAVVNVLTVAGSLDGRIVIDAANMMGQDRLSLRRLADSFPRARWVRAFNTLQARVLADENHRQPRWILFLSGDETAKPTVAQLITDAGLEPADLGGIDDSQFQEPGSALWNTTLDTDQAKALAARVRAGQATADPLTAAFEKLRDHAPEDPALFFEHLSRAVFQAGISWRVVSAKWDGIRDAFHGFDPGKVASLQSADIAQIEADAQVIRNSAKIEATVQNAQEILAILRAHGSIRGYLASFPDARAAAADLRRRFRFLGDTGVWRLLTSAARDLG